MYLVLFGVGLLVTAAGLVTVGFGIPINAFSLGNTLIISGTIAIVGGFILLGIAAAIRQLNRIVVAINKGIVARPAAPQAPVQGQVQAPQPPVHAPAADVLPDTLVPPTARMPQPPVRAPAKAPDPVPPRPSVEPHFPAANEPAPANPLEWLRSKPKAPSAPEPVLEVPDEAPLSPRPPQRPMFSPPPVVSAPVAEQPAEPKSWMPSRGNDMPEHKEPSFGKEPRSDFAPPRAERVARAAPPQEMPREPGRDAGRSGGKDGGLFDVVWPDARSKPMPSAEPAREAKSEPRFDPPPPPRPREEPRAERRAEPPSERPSAILKSGVIDGMAYTLYADGSIEAELPQGTVRFASVDALRAHLEKSV